MCTCASCEYTDGFAGKGVAEWPRGDPAGKRASEALYSSHVQYGRKWGGSRKPECSKVVSRSGTRREDPHALYHFPNSWNRRTNTHEPKAETTPEYVALFVRLNGLKEASPALAEPARPAQAGKPEQHFPERDRAPETAVIYAMPKSKEQKPKRSRGRPALQGRRVVIKLKEEQILRAEKLGGGNVAAGIRKALARRASGSD